MPKQKTQSNKPLTGEKLLSKIKQLDHLSREEKAKACGYYSFDPDGSERLNVMAFLNAILDAEGVNLDAKVSQNGSSTTGRQPSYTVSVQTNGNLLVGAAYTKQMELNPGDTFEIALGRKHIHLTKIEAKG
ncbi:AbrB family transcriptional regulator [Acaryochloris sp. IP29b_bin.148]|uniref:AbrB family transcriptional regulator n=1 Tax=Acaryochloris sp. IP29b_bin.148 TaxID=2969218 RepID=UPI002606B5BA|nr:AbrB family transcriptional regulator [Acaryochloris sp. IP29b_bin.148]